MGGATAKEMTIAVLRYPTRSRQVRLPRAPRSVWLAVGIDVQHELGDFPPIGALLIGVQEAQIGHEVLLVITSQDAIRWR